MLLSEDNFLFYAINHYDNIQCYVIEEFEEDLKRFLYLKKLFTRHYNDNQLRERLILNHIIVLYNVFGAAATDMLFFKIDKEHESALATFLVYLNRLPDHLISQIPIDTDVAAALRKI